MRTKEQRQCSKDSANSAKAKGKERQCKQCEQDKGQDKTVQNRNRPDQGFFFFFFFWGGGEKCFAHSYKRTLLIPGYLHVTKFRSSMLATEGPRDISAVHATEGPRSISAARHPSAAKEPRDLMQQKRPKAVQPSCQGA